jgi:hypothetical protein
MSRSINYTILEETLINTFGINADELADQNGYPTKVAIPEADLPDKVEVEKINPATGQVEMMLDYPAGIEFDMENPQPRIDWLAEKLLEAGIREVAKAPRSRMEREALQSAKGQIDAMFETGIKTLVQNTTKDIIV